jgi:hypothetical protein
VRIATLLVIGALLIACPSWAQTQNATKPAAAASAGALPPSWDSKIPLPKGAMLVSSTKPKVGVVYSANFSVAGNYKDLVDFYETEIPKAGFQLGPKVAVPARKVYNRSFIRKSALDSVVITPSTHDPDKFTISITYTPASK